MVRVLNRNKGSMFNIIWINIFFIAVFCTAFYFNCRVAWNEWRLHCSRLLDRLFLEPVPFINLTEIILGLLNCNGTSLIKSNDFLSLFLLLLMFTSIILVQKFFSGQSVTCRDNYCMCLLSVFYKNYFL